MRDTQQLPARHRLVAHVGRMRSGSLDRSQAVTATVDPAHRLRLVHRLGIRFLCVFYVYVPTYLPVKEPKIGGNNF